MKKKTKRKIIYDDPPMVYNVALHKFEPNLPIIKKSNSKNQIETNPLIILTIIMIMLGILWYFIIKLG